MKSCLRRFRGWLRLTLLVTVAANAGFAAGEVATLPAGVRRVVFLGDSITYSGAYVCTVAAYFATRHPAREIEFINVGLSSETVSGLSEEGHAGGKFPRPDLHERLGRVLTQTRPDLVFACYGMNDGIYLPLAEERFQKFRDGMERLHRAVVATGARVVHLTPPPYDDARGGRPPGYGAVLQTYSAWLLQRRAAGWEVVDLHTPMRRFLEEERARDPSFFLSRDGVHPGEVGHWLMAREILRHLGARDLETTANAVAMVGVHPHGPALLRLVTRRHEIQRDAWLTATGHTRPGVKAGLPLADAAAAVAELERERARLR